MLKAAGKMIEIIYKDFCFFLELGLVLKVKGQTLLLLKRNILEARSIPYHW